MSLRLLTGRFSELHFASGLISQFAEFSCDCDTDSNGDREDDEGN
jgi:hypothetical protein